MFIKSIATAVLAVSFAGAALAQDDTNASLLAKSPEAQAIYLESSLSMAATLLPKTQGLCIRQWEKGHKGDGYKNLVEAIKKYPDYHPTLVITAAMEQVCGKFELARN